LCRSLGREFERLHPYDFFGLVQHQGRLDFRDARPAALASVGKRSAFHQVLILSPTSLGG